MSDTQQEQPEGDLEVETIDMQQKRTVALPRPRSPLEPHLSPRQRAQRLAVTGGVVVLALLLLLGSIPTLRAGVVGALTGWLPAPTVPPIPVMNRFYIDLSVPWASVSLDGHPIRPPRIGTEAPVVLSRGRHIFAWQADPFEPQQCTLSIPAASGDTCPIEPASVTFGLAKPSAQLVRLSESFNTLAGPQQQALIKAAQAALDQHRSSSIVQPGEHYVTKEHGVVVATQPLRATLSFTLELGAPVDMWCQLDMRTMTPEPCEFEQQNCLILCPAPTWLVYPKFILGGSVPADWTVFAVAQSSWDYASMQTGQIIARNEPIDLEKGGMTGHLVPLGVHWDGTRWHVYARIAMGPSGNVFLGNRSVQLAHDLACAAAIDLFVASRDLAHYSWVSLGSELNPASGCIIVASLAGVGSSAVNAEYFERFGVLLAVNRVAQHLRPDLPVADTYEVSLERQLASSSILNLKAP